MSTVTIVTASLFFALGCAPAPAIVPAHPPHQAGIFADSVFSATGMLHGTLIVPTTDRSPVALIIAGSGPTDREGNNPLVPGKSNSLRYLAEALAARGIASLRYDKRGIGQSRMQGGLPTDLRFEHYVDDAVAWGKKLRMDPRFSSVIVVGHSEGSLIAMLATPRIPAAKVVSIAGLGFPAPEGIVRQVRAALPADQAAQVETALARVQRGEEPGQYPPSMLGLFHPNVLPYLRSWFPYDPRTAAAQVGAPLLVVQGLHDFQALEEDARAIAGSNPRAVLKLIPGMNHVLKQSPAARAEQGPAYSDSTLAIDRTLVDAIAEFVIRPRN